jgi:hypothetical protein
MSEVESLFRVVCPMRRQCRAEEKWGEKGSLAATTDLDRSFFFFLFHFSNRPNFRFIPKTIYP